MRKLGLFIVLAIFAMAPVAGAQPITWDFEGLAAVSELVDQGWDIRDEPTYAGTITLETGIVHSGTQALRMGYRDLAYYPLNGEFGTLDLWAFDYGYRNHVYLAGGAGYGSRFGMRKEGSDAYDYGIGAGLVDKTSLDADGGYGLEWGATANALKVAYANWVEGMDPIVPWSPNGWSSTQGWYSPAWGGYLPNGRPPMWDGATGGGWNHWQISYTEAGVVGIQLLETWAGDTRPAGVGTPANAFDGTTPGGLDDIYLFGGLSSVAGYEPELLFGDGIFDDITWTPIAQEPAFIPGDADGDGTVDIPDFVLLKNNFGATGATWGQGDFDGDGTVDIPDFVILKNNFGATAVPEPATMSLLALGGLAVIRRRK